MRSRILSLICLVPLLVSACGSVPAVNPPQAQPTTYNLVAIPPDATPTPTPFQPVKVELNPAISPVVLFTVTPAQPQATFDPNSILSATATPASFYIPSYAPEPAATLDMNGVVSFLLLGSDKRPGQKYFRTDTILVALVRPASGQVSLISVPRDLYVYIPTVGMDRVNTAYEYGEMYNYQGGGFALLKDTILYNLGLSIDHLAIVDFDGFRKIVDTLGGIDVPVFCSYTDWHLIDPGYDPENENNWELYTVGPGMEHMDGDLALWYARSRKRSSDFDRGRRSQEVLRALFARAMQTNSIGKIPELYTDFSSSLITDLGLADLLKLSPLALHLSNADIRGYYIGHDLVSAWITPGGASVQLPNGEAIQAMLQQALSPSASRQEKNVQKIEVRNGTTNPGWDALAAERLNYLGYETRLTYADRQNYPSSLLYDLGGASDMNLATPLMNILGLPASAYISAPMEQDVQYVLIIGADYQPCFNPESISP